MQVGDRRHLWHGLAGTALREVGAHAFCWSKSGPLLPESETVATTRERWRRVHDLLDQSVGLLACARSLGVSLNAPAAASYVRHVVEQTFALLHQFKRLAVRWEHRPELYDAFVSLACSLICWRRLKKTHT
ncbi:hypothetical protein [Streptomyces beigongshangae]|uniref:hypothetical protein n=1 Tax=Streptomyces beigongshangae TaxID=2841597 RepID=UPI001C84368B|nr:hypothetical protein [Streptomyces sp. REN17]